MQKSFESTSDTLMAMAQAAGAKGIAFAKEHGGRPINDFVVPNFHVEAAMPGSTDVGDVSYVTPTAQAMIAGFCIGTAPHTWQVTGQTGSSIGEKGYLKAGEVLALAAAKVIDCPEMAAKAREELVAETGGVYNCPAPDDVLPPIPEGVAQRAKEAGL